MAEPPKIADRPHYWTVFLSLLAVGVSFASFYQSKQAVRISREVSRAAVQVNSVRLTDTPERLSFLRVDLTLTNYGQVTARDVSTTLEWDISDFDLPIKDATYKHQPFGNLAPKSSKTARLQANRRFTSAGMELQRDSGPTRPTHKLLVYGVVHYTDDVSGLRGSDPWCFFFDPRDNPRGDPLDLRACEDRPTDPEKGQ